MTKEAALQQFFSMFKIPAYKSTEVPPKAEFPYLTYTETVGSWEQGNQSLTVNLWYYGTGEKEPNFKAEEIAELIGYGGYVVPCDGGFIWLKKGTPWCQSMTDPLDPKIKRRYINVNAEFMTLN